MKQQEINKLLNEYRLGTISVENRQLLEQLAVEDDFVFDALQGMNAGPSSNASMNKLRVRLVDRVSTQKKRKILPFWIPGAAAAILVLLGVVWLINPSKDSAKQYAAVADAKEVVETSSKEEDNDSYAVEDMKTEEIVLENTEDEALTDLVIEEVKTIENAVEEKNEPSSNNSEFSNSSVSSAENSSPPSSVITKDVVPIEPNTPQSAEDIIIANGSTDFKESYDSDDSFGQGEKPEEEDVEEYEDIAAGDLNTEYSPERKTSSPPAEQVSKKAREKSSVTDGVAIKKEVFNTYSGTVTDSYGDPLIGASLEIKGTKIGAVTDIDGNVTFENITVENPRLIVSYTGYITAEIPLVDDFNVELNDGAVLDEVVVVSGYGIIEPSKPKMGWDKFNQLVESQLNNINVSQEQNNEIVQVDFIINAKGFPSDFEIVKGKNNPKAAILIQLLQTSGKWTNGQGTYSF